MSNDRQYRTGLKTLAAATAMALSSGAVALDVPGPVVDREWLSANLGDDNLVVIDIRHPVDSAFVAPEWKKDEKTGEEYLARVGGHISGATVVDAKTIRAKRDIDGETVKKLIPDRESFERLMQSWGVDADDTIVIAPMGFGAGDMTNATRLYWQMKYYGEDDIAILDGGTSGWLAAGGEHSAEKRTAESGDWSASEEREEILATTQEVEAAQGSGVQIVDTRSPNQYMGVFTKSYVFDDGHIAGAKNYPTSLMSEAGMATNFLAAERYRKLMTRLGINPDSPAITTCNSGHLGSGGWFILHEILGNDNVALYDGSMHEWTLRGNKAVAF